jgi:hypothetical protein
MFTSPDGFLSGGDETPWQLAQVALERWERAIDRASIEYEELVRRLAEIFAQGNRAAWLDGREMTVLSRRRLAGILRGDRSMIDRVLRGRHTWAG